MNRVMAGKASLLELFFVGILVAIRTFALQPEKRTGKRTTALYDFFRHPYVVRFVAIPAGQQLVRPGQWKACDSVIEGLNPIFPENQIEIPSMVLDVAHVAFSMRFQPVQSLALGHLGPYQGVTGKAFFSRDLFPRRMAPGAILDAFQKGVHLVKFSGRNLRRGRVEQAEEQQAG